MAPGRTDYTIIVAAREIAWPRGRSLRPANILKARSKLGFQMSDMLKVGKNALLDATENAVVLILLDLPQLGWERLHGIDSQDGFAVLKIGEGSSRVDRDFSLTCTVDKILAILTADESTSKRFTGR